VTNHQAGRIRPALALAVDEQEQLPRLRRFQASHPQVVIGTLGARGAWQARIPEPDGETVATRWHLRDLLDRLAELLGEPGADDTDRNRAENRS
jgi:hypothetical protein